MSIPVRVLIVEDRADDAELMLEELRRGGDEPLFERVDWHPTDAGHAARTGTSSPRVRSASAARPEEAGGALLVGALS